MTILYLLKAKKVLSNTIRKGYQNPSKAVRGDLEGFTKIFPFYTHMKSINVQRNSKKSTP